METQWATSAGPPGRTLFGPCAPKMGPEAFPPCKQGPPEAARKQVLSEALPVQAAEGSPSSTATGRPPKSPAAARGDGGAGARGSALDCDRHSVAHSVAYAGGTSISPECPLVGPLWATVPEVPTVSSPGFGFTSSNKHTSSEFASADPSSTASDGPPGLTMIKDKK